MASDTEDGTYAKLKEATIVLLGTSIDDDSVVPGVTYWYKVSAKSSAWNSSAFSDPDSGFATGNEISEFGSWTEGTISAGQAKWYHFAVNVDEVIEIRWDDSSDDGSGTYGCDISVSAYREDFTTAYFEDKENGYSMHELIVAAETELVYLKVEGADDSESGDFALMATISYVPRFVTASDGTYSDHVKITWGSVSGADFYYVKRSDSESGEYTTIAGDFPNPTTCNDFNVAPGQIYWYKVSTVNYVGAESDLSDADSGFASASDIGTEITVFDSWVEGALSAGEIQWYYFNANNGEVYNIFFDDSWEGSGSYDSIIRVSAYREDQTTAYFEDAIDGYIIPKQLSATDTEKVYIKVALDQPEFAGDFAIKVEDQATPAAFYYIETFPNGSGNNADTVLYVYDEGLSQIAANDDKMGTDYYYSELKLWLESGTKIYCMVEDPYQSPAETHFYSIRISDSGFGGSSSGTASEPDAFEPDDSSGSATILILDVVQDHSLAVGPSADDWFTFTAP